MEPITLSTQQQNAMSKWLQSLQKLYDAAFQLKSDRAVLDLLGVSQLPEDVVFPGDLSHITSARVTAGLQAMNVLDAALISPAQIKDETGKLIATILPLKAIVELLR